MRPPIDGPTLKALRQSQHISIRRIAREAGLSHGHLSKVENGEAGRPVTPAVLRAYEKVVGARLEGGSLLGPAGWRAGQLPGRARRAYTARVAAAATGGLLDPQVGPRSQLRRALDHGCRLPLPESSDTPVTTELAELATILGQLDGTAAGLAARTVLRWMIELVDPVEEGRTDLYRAIGLLAQRAARTAIAIECHHQARELFVVTVHAAVLAGDPELRARALAGVAGQYLHLGHYEDAAAVARFGEVDERASGDLRTLLGDLKQRGIAGTGPEPGGGEPG